MYTTDWYASLRIRHEAIGCVLFSRDCASRCVFFFFPFLSLSLSRSFIFFATCVPLLRLFKTRDDSREFDCFFPPASTKREPRRRRAPLSPITDQKRVQPRTETAKQNEKKRKRTKNARSDFQFAACPPPSPHVVRFPFFGCVMTSDSKS